MIFLQVQASIQEKETYRKELTLAKEKVDTDVDDEGEDTGDDGYDGDDVNCVAGDNPCKKGGG